MTKRSNHCGQLLTENQQGICVAIFGSVREDEWRRTVVLDEGRVEPDVCRARSVGNSSRQMDTNHTIVCTGCHPDVRAQRLSCSSFEMQRLSTCVIGVKQCCSRVEVKYRLGKQDGFDQILSKRAGGAVVCLTSLWSRLYSICRVGDYYKATFLWHARREIMLP